MCTLFVLINKIPNVPVAIISNRDEMQDRLSLPLQGWSKDFSSPGNVLYAPRDEIHGGTWFGFLNENDFKYAFLTNIRAPDLKQTQKKSRGGIIPSFLNYVLTPKCFIQELKKMRNEYNFFNLIFGNKNECYYFNSQTQESKILWNKSQKRIKLFGLSNGRIDSNWPKIQETKEKFSKLKFRISRHSDPLENYYNLLAEEMLNKKKYPLEDLPITGVGAEIEVFLSSLFISHEKYGTRSTLFFAFNTVANSAHIFEKNYTPNALIEKEVKFKLPNKSQTEIKNYYEYK